MIVFAPEPEDDWIQQGVTATVSQISRCAQFSIMDILVNFAFQILQIMYFEACRKSRVTGLNKTIENKIPFRHPKNFNIYCVSDICMYLLFNQHLHNL